MAGEGPAVEIRKGFVGSFSLWLRVQEGYLIPDVGLMAKQSLVVILLFIENNVQRVAFSCALLFFERKWLGWSIVIRFNKSAAGDTENIKIF